MPYLRCAPARVLHCCSGETRPHAPATAGSACIDRRHLRESWFQCCRQRTYLPADICKGHGIQPEDVLSGSISDKLREVVFRVAACAKVSTIGNCHRHMYQFTTSHCSPSAVALYSLSPCRCFAALQGHLDDARATASDVPREARPLLLSSVGTGLYLDALERAEFDPFGPHLAKGGFSPLWHQLVVKGRLLRRTF